MRRAVPADAPAIWAIHTRAIREVASAHYDPATIDAWSRRTTPASYAEPMLAHVMLVAEDGEGGVVGFAELDPRDGVVRACYVDPDYVRHGVGRALIGGVEQEAKALGRTMLVLDASLNSVPFYEALGWRVDARARHPLGHGASLDCALMSKRLA